MGSASQGPEVPDEGQRIPLGASGRMPRDGRRLLRDSRETARSSFWLPERPRGVHDIYAEVDDSVPDGTIINYSLFQVIFETGSRRKENSRIPS